MGKHPLVRAARWRALASICILLGLVGADGVPGFEATRDVTRQAAMFGESDAYERFMGRWSRRLAPLFVEFAGVGAADSVLDIGAGTGALTAALIQLHPGVRVTGIDPSAEYVARAAKDLGASRTRFVVGDAQQLRLPDASFDQTLSLLVVNFIPDRDKAMREMIRVTRPGGTIAAAVWDYAEGMEMLRLFWDEAVALAPAADRRDERHMPLCKPGELAAFWRAHGLAHVEERSLEIRMDFASFDDYWAPLLGGQGPAGAYVATLDGAQREALVERLKRRLDPAANGRPFSLRGRAWAVKGRKPN